MINKQETLCIGENFISKSFVSRLMKASPFFLHLNPERLGQYLKSSDAKIKSICGEFGKYIHVF